MKYVKILGLLAVAAAAFMAFAGTASADTATSPTGTEYTGPIHASAEGHAVLDNPIAKISCASTVGGTIDTDAPGVKVSGPIETLSFTNCTDDWHVTVVTAGRLSADGYAGSYDGDIYSSGATVEATRFGISCRYATETTTVGRLTGGVTPTMHINGAIPFHSGSIFCGSGATTWTGSYTVSTPGSLYIDNN